MSEDGENRFKKPGSVRAADAHSGPGVKCVVEVVAGETLCRFLFGGQRRAQGVWMKTEPALGFMTMFVFILLSARS